MMATILITAYLVIGALAFGLIWVVLIASKRREDKSQNINRDRSETQPFHKPASKPSRFHS